MSARKPHGPLGAESATQADGFRENPEVEEETTSSPPPSTADAARAPTPAAAADRRRIEDQAISLLRGIGLEGTAGAARAVLARYPDGNPLEAAHTVLAWWYGGLAKTRSAAPLLNSALGSQPARLAAASEAEWSEPGEGLGLMWRERLWVREHLPDRVEQGYESLLVAALCDVRLKHGNWSVELVTARFEQRFAEQIAEDKA